MLPLSFLGGCPALLLASRSCLLSSRSSTQIVEWLDANRLHGKALACPLSGALGSSWSAGWRGLSHSFEAVSVQLCSWPSNPYLKLGQYHSTPGPAYYQWGPSIVSCPWTAAYTSAVLHAGSGQIPVLSLLLVLQTSCRGRPVPAHPTSAEYLQLWIAWCHSLQQIVHAKGRL